MEVFVGEMILSEARLRKLTDLSSSVLRHSLKAHDDQQTDTRIETVKLHDGVTSRCKTHVCVYMCGCERVIIASPLLIGLRTWRHNYTYTSM